MVQEVDTYVDKCPQERLMGPKCRNMVVRSCHGFQAKFGTRASQLGRAPLPAGRHSGAALREKGVFFRPSNPRTNFAAISHALVCPRGVGTPLQIMGCQRFVSIAVGGNNISSRLLLPLFDAFVHTGAPTQLQRSCASQVSTKSAIWSMWLPFRYNPTSLPLSVVG